MGRRLSIAGCIAILAICASTSAFADITTGFEVGDPTPQYRTGGAGASNQDCTVAYIGSCSARLDLPNLGNDSAAAGIAWYSPLADIAYSSVWGKTNSSTSLFPYLDYYVDSNQNGAIQASNDTGPDSLVVLVASPSFSQGVWQQVFLTGNSMVHVSGYRPGLAADQFTPSNPGTLDALLATSIGGSETWGDLDVWRVRAEVGNWGASGPAYTAYVDDLSVGTVPEPGAIVLFGTVLGIMVGTGRRKLFRR